MQLPTRVCSSAHYRTLPLSYAQEQVWLSHQMNSSMPRHLTVAAQLHGEVNRRALRAALNAVVERHDVLRAIFQNVDNKPAQVIRAADGRFALQEQEAAHVLDVERIKCEEALDPFDLANGPLIRGRLLRMSDQEYVLLISLHRIIADYRSIEVLLQEMSSHYNAINVGQRDPLRPPELQYADYSSWQRQHVTTETLHNQLEFWRRKLSVAPSMMQLSSDRPRGVRRCYSADRVQLTLSMELVVRLQGFAERLGVTMFATLLSGWAVLIGRWSRQQEVIIGIRAPNRPTPQTKSLIGPFENTMLVRAQLEKSSTVEQLVQQMAATIAEARAHQDVPFDQVIRALDSVDGHTPILQVLMGMDETSAETIGSAQMKSPGLALADFHIANVKTELELSLSLREDSEGLIGTIEYASDLYERGTIERMTACWRTLLDGMVRGAQQQSSQLPMLTEAERAQVLRTFNDTAVSYRENALIHELFEEQVQRTQHVVALLHGQQSLTYAELNRRANQLARCLRKQGVGPDQLVALCVERSAEMIVGLLGILKAGGAYLPLDPSYPAERLAHMLKDAAPAVLLTQEKLAATLPALDAIIIALDRQEISEYVDSNIPAAELNLTAKNLVYVIYTSGSTGRPKGTTMAHRSMVNLIEWHRNNSLAGEGKRVLQFAALSFDVAFQEIMSTLCTGGTLVLLDEWVRRDAFALADLLRSQSIHRLFVPPLMLQGLAKSLQGADEVPTNLEDIIAAGEQLRISPEIVSLFHRLERCRLHNHYGPTESHVVTALTLAGDAADWPMVPTIGRPIANTQIYILDQAHRVVPVGVVGEIYIGGAGVARGYLNQPELTAERFIVDPFSSDPRARVYKTGDLGRWRSDGTIEYVGRNDHQVKIRGFRIELGDIEAQLVQHKQVKEAAVIAREDITEDRRLVAYVIPRDEAQPPTVDGLRAYLSAVLPSHMVPSAFFLLGSLPTTPNGKLDRRALPAPGLEAYASHKYERPLGAVEEALAAIWQQLLGVERIGRKHQFFELGGDSLRVMKLVVSVAETFVIQFDTRIVLRCPVLQDMAEAIQVLLSSSQGSLPSSQTELEDGVI